jgi:hypothetical protein
MRHQILAMLAVYSEGGQQDCKVEVDGDMNFLGQGIAALCDKDRDFADVIIAAMDFYRLKRGLTYEGLAKLIEKRVIVLTNPGKATAP